MRKKNCVVGEEGKTCVVDRDGVGQLSAAQQLVDDSKGMKEGK